MIMSIVILCILSAILYQAVAVLESVGSKIPTTQLLVSVGFSDV